MPISPPLDEIHDARTRWLNGDPGAWSHYLACCGTLDTEARTPPSERIGDPRPAPRLVRSRTGWGTTRRRGRRTAAAYR